MKITKTLLFLGFLSLFFLERPLGASAATYTHVVVGPGYVETFVYDLNLNQAIYGPYENIVASGTFISGMCTNGVSLSSLLNAQNTLDSSSLSLFNYSTWGTFGTVTFVGGAGNSDPHSTVAFSNTFGNFASIPYAVSVTPVIKLKYSPVLPPVKINSFAGSPIFVKRCGSPTPNASTLSWNVSNALSCSGNWSGGSSLSLPTGSVSVSGGTANTDVSEVPTFTLTCTNSDSSDTSVTSVTFSPNSTNYCNSFSSGGGCFIVGTQVMMADGSSKDIAEVSPGDFILSSQGPTQVMKKYVIPYQGLLYAFNGSGNYFVTPTHPFMTSGGWKSFDPEGTKQETPSLAVSLLAVGDELVRNDGTLFRLTQVDSRPGEQTVYNFGLNGSHDFYADGFLVHNVNLSDFIPLVHASVFSEKR